MAHLSFNAKVKVEDILKVVGYFPILKSNDRTLKNHPKPDASRWKKE
jgi:hypothetical protein